MQQKRVYGLASLVIALVMSVAAFVPALAGNGDKDWATMAIDGGGQVVAGRNAFHNSTIEVHKKVITLSQSFDADFENENPAPAWPASERYNNAFLTGYQGFQPTDKKDVVWNFEFKVDPGFYGSTGFVVERKDTFASDGSFRGPAFDFFGITYVGPESFMSGLNCMDVLNAQPVNSQPLTADPFQWNEYQIRFHKIDATSTLATVSINGSQACQMTIADMGPSEVQIWSDNYKIGVDANWNIIRGFNNKPDPQSVHFREVKVEMDKVKREKSK